MAFPTYKEFLKNINDDKDDYYRFDFYCEYCSEVTTNSIISDHTNESVSEDEREWVRQQTNEDLYKQMAKDEQESLFNRVRNKIPKQELIKRMSADELKEIERLEKIRTVLEI
jgi:hypothetical protein